MMQCDNLMIILLSNPISVLTFLQLNQYMFRINAQIKNPEIISQWKPVSLYGIDSTEYPNAHLSSIDFRPWLLGTLNFRLKDQTQMAYHVMLLLNDFYWVITTRLIWVKRNESNLSI